MPPRGRGPENDPYMGGGGYRPSRPSRPAYGTDSRANMRAELDMRGPDPYDPYARPRPIAERSGMNPALPIHPKIGTRIATTMVLPCRLRTDVLVAICALAETCDPVVTCVPVAICVRAADMRPGSGPPLPPNDLSDGPPYYGGGSRPGDDRVRRRRPSKTRDDLNDRYRLDPGPPRPDYRPGGRD